MKQNNLSKLFEYAGKYKYLTISSWILSVISALFALAPFIYIWAIIKEVIEIAPNFENAQNIVHNGWMAVIFSVISILVNIAALMCSHISAFRIASNIKKKLMHHIVTLPLGFMDNIGSGKLRKIVNETSESSETYLAHQLPDYAAAITTPIGLLLLLLFFDWKLGLLSLIPIALAFMIMSAMTGKRMQEKMKEYQNALGNMSNEAVEYVRGIPVVKTFGQSVFSFKKFKKSIDEYGKWVIAYTKDLRMPMVFFTTIINSVFAVLIIVTLVVTKNSITSDFLLNLLFYIIITPIISVSLNKIMFLSENGMIVNDALERINGILAIVPLKATNKFQELKENSIRVSNLSFKYPGADTNTLHDISFEINSGEKVAFVGPSGGGKTTLARIIARFWDPDNGAVFIGNINVKDISKYDLMNEVSFVFQDSKLLKTSILENVRMAKPNATDNEVIKALNMAQCMDILEKMPKGIDTVVGTKGVYLSGGEVQRIDIARAMLKNSPILILDEATAFADPDNEAKVQKAFNNLSKDKTVIIIAHRLSTIVGADKIIVMKDGKVEESGTHDELIKKSGLYSKMWNDYHIATDWKFISGGDAK